MPVVSNAVERIPVNAVGRDFAVGDIHGCFTKLAIAMGKVHFDPQKDRLFSVGDLVDRGPESHQVLTWLDQPWFYAISGNHELLTWRRALGNPIKEVDHRQHGGLWLDACSPEQQQRIGERLQALPWAFEIATPEGPVGIVHADFPYDDWRKIHEQEFSPEDIDVCHWSVQRYQQQYPHAIKNVRAVVHGHKTINRMAQLGNVYFIDTGGWRSGGHFTLLNLHTLRAM